MKLNNKHLFNKKPIPILIIGDEYETYNIAKKILDTKSHIYDIKYIYKIKNITDDINEIINLVEDVDEIILCANVSSKIKSKIISYSLDVNVKVNIIPNFYELALYNSDIKHFDDIAACKVNNFKLTLQQKIFKRILDIIIAIIGLIIFLPLMLTISLLIKVNDKGPVFFIQERITEKNKPFNIIKFRTMIVDAEKSTGPIWSFEEDKRITPIGKILRNTKLDELPQLFNVLKGDMSIVGPRPERSYFIKEFCKSIPEFKYRLNVKAGITGFAQVLGKYTTNPENKLRYDLIYINNYSLLLDLKLIIQTVKVILLKENLHEDILSYKTLIDEIIATSLEEVNIDKNNE